MVAKGCSTVRFFSFRRKEVSNRRITIQSVTTKLRSFTDLIRALLLGATALTCHDKPNIVVQTGKKETMVDCY